MGKWTYCEKKFYDPNEKNNSPEEVLFSYLPSHSTWNCSCVYMYLKDEKKINDLSFLRCPK